jgi:hypothetical protein
MITTPIYHHPIGGSEREAMQVMNDGLTVNSQTGSHTKAKGLQT